jgi:hypothetical protein
VVEVRKHGHYLGTGFKTSDIRIVQKSDHLAHSTLGPRTLIPHKHHARAQTFRAVRIASKRSTDVLDYGICSDGAPIPVLHLTISAGVDVIAHHQS